MKFIPRDTGKYEGLLQLLVVDNPYVSLTIDLKAEVYAELVVLEGLELVSVESAVINERRESNSRHGRSSSQQASVTEGDKTYKGKIKKNIRTFTQAAQIFREHLKDILKTFLRS